MVELSGNRYQITDVLQGMSACVCVCKTRKRNAFYFRADLRLPVDRALKRPVYCQASLRDDRDRILAELSYPLKSEIAVVGSALNQSGYKGYGSNRRFHPSSSVKSPIASALRCDGPFRRRMHRFGIFRQHASGFTRAGLHPAGFTLGPFGLIDRDR